VSGVRVSDHGLDSELAFVARRPISGELHPHVHYRIERTIAGGDFALPAWRSGTRPMAHQVPLEPDWSRLQACAVPPPRGSLVARAPSGSRTLGARL
jgi:hypothetical protein